LALRSIGLPTRFAAGGNGDASSGAKGEIELGFWREGKRPAGLFRNPDRDAEWHLDEADAIVLLSSVAEPRADTTV
jgi:hypothetical protein